MSDDGPSLASLVTFQQSLWKELDTLWLLITTLLVLLMQCGFAMLEVGSVNDKNTKNILLKNVLDLMGGAIIWWWLGFGLASGHSPSRCIGTDMFGLLAEDFEEGSGYTYASWLFEWASAATTATIISGTLAERCTLTTYITLSLCIIGFIYPVVVQMAWGENGLFSPWLKSDNKKDYFMECGVIDFAGGAVVHMTAGVSALTGAIFMGPRKSFVNGTNMTPPYGPIFQTLGTLMLWFGWYGLNGGSILYFVGNAQVVAKVMTSTTMSAATGGVATLIIGTALDFRKTGEFVILIEHLNNGVLAGLVGVTAGCAVVEPYGACIIGVGSSLVYIYSEKLLRKYGIDDVVEAVPIHGCCGCYGVIMASLLATKSNYKAAYGIYEGAEDTCAGVLYGGKVNGLAAALCFCLFVFLWTGACSCVMFGGLKYMNWIRVSDAAEEDGADKEIELYIIPTFAITFSTASSHKHFQLAFSDKSHLQVFPEGKGM